jgi:hypothetical protein
MCCFDAAVDVSDAPNDRVRGHVRLGRVSRTWPTTLADTTVREFDGWPNCVTRRNAETQTDIQFATLTF